MMKVRRADAVDVEVGRRLRTHRITKGMSQTDLGRRAGVTFQQVQKYEKGSNRVSMGRLQKMATALGVPMTVFYDSLDASVEKKPDGPAYELLQDPHAIRMLQAFNSIHGNARAKLLELAETIAGRRRKN